MSSRSEAVMGILPNVCPVCRGQAVVVNRRTAMLHTFDCRFTRSRWEYARIRAEVRTGRTVEIERVA